MINLPQMVEKFCGPYRHKMKQLVEPLQKTFGINYFFYFYLTKSRECCAISSDEKIAEDFIMNKMYLCNPLFHPSVNWNAGMYLYDSIKHSAFQSSMDSLTQRHKAKHSCLLVKKEPQRDVIYGFAFPPERESNALLLFNQCSLLTHYTLYFEQEMRRVLDYMESSPVDLKKEIGFCNTMHVAPTSLDPVKIALFLKQTNRYRLTQRDIECIELLVKGMTAPSIAKNLHLSVRTIEHRIQLLKDKFHCKTKPELVLRLQREFPLHCSAAPFSKKN